MSTTATVPNTLDQSQPQGVVPSQTQPQNQTALRWKDTDTVPMISPDGDIGDVPRAKVNDAVKSGFKVGVDMIAPDGKAGKRGTMGTIPVDSVHDAIHAGFQMAPPPIIRPVPKGLQESPDDTSAGP